MTTVMVSGVLAGRPLNGGGAWVRLSWVLGLRRLGFDVVFVDQIDPQACVDAAGRPADFARSANLAYFRAVTERSGLGDSSVLVLGQGERTHGRTFTELLELAEACELLVNISGHLRIEPLLRRLRRRAYVDIDPGFTQFWHTAGSLPVGGHDFYFTIGQNIGSRGCPIPTGGIRWRPTRQPVVLDHWQPSPEGDPNRFTTIASWRGAYAPIEYRGRTFGVKVHEFRKFLSLPSHARQAFEIALEIHPADERDRRRLIDSGWRLTDPHRVAGDPAAFRRYVMGSGGEFSVAQGLYVETGSGWFSDRTVRYLASGKPALVQDTGFSRNYPVGEGLIPFRTLGEAVTGACSIERDYARHRRAARAVAEAVFDSDRVLGELAEEVGVAP
jgi:hypothetical protein